MRIFLIVFISFNGLLFSQSNDKGDNLSFDYSENLTNIYESPENLTKTPIQVYKEINSNIITVSGLSSQIGYTAVSLYNILGKKVLYKNFSNLSNSQSFSISGIHKGIYIIEFQNKNFRYSKKLVIN